MALIGQTYSIPEENLPTLKAKLDKLLKRAKKLGLEPVEYEVGEPVDKQFVRVRESTYEYEQYRDRVWEMERRTGQPLTREIPGYFGNHRVFIRRYYPVVVYGKPPTLAGWTFVATIQPLTDDNGKPMNLLRVIPGWTEKLPEKYRTAGPDCDHCHLKRRRLETYIVYNAENGEYKQIGSSCLADFLGQDNPQSIAKILEYIFEAMAAGEGGEEGGFGGGDRGPRRWSLMEFLVCTAAVIRREGWMSRGKAYEMNGGDRFGPHQATADIVIYLLSPSPDGSVAEDKRKKKLDVFLKESEETKAGDTKLAEDAIAYAKETLGAKGDERSDYEHNLYVAISQSSIDERLAGITASVIPFYTKEVAKRASKAAEADSKHFGTEGEKIMVPATLVAVIPIEGMYTSFLHRFITAEGNVATWFASSNQQAEIGKEYLVVATIKKHDTFRGVKQTILTRATLLEGEKRRVFEAEVAEKAARAAAKAAGVKPSRKPKQGISTNSDPEVEAAIARFPETFSLPGRSSTFRINGPKSKKHFHDVVSAGGVRTEARVWLLIEQNVDGKWKRFTETPADILSADPPIGYGVATRATSLSGIDGISLGESSHPLEWIISDLRDIEYSLSALRPYFEEEHVGGSGGGLPRTVEEELNEIVSVIDDVYQYIERARDLGHRVDALIIEDYNRLREELRSYLDLA